MNSETQSLVPATRQTESVELTVEQVRENLSVTEKGQPANTIGNCRTVFVRDPLLRGAIRLNLLTDRVDIVRDLGWRRSTSALTDTDVKYLLLYFEQNYGLTSEKKMLAALSIVANENCYHPIQDVLNSLVWDGKPRIRSCLHHFLGADERSVDFGTLVTHPLRIIILLVGFLVIKMAMLWLIARPLNVPGKQRSWFAVLLGQGSEFAFVVFGAAQMANVLDPEWAKALTLAVALSMAATPVLLVVLTRLEKSGSDQEREADEIDEEQPRVIIAGFGRYGQIVGRLLLSSGVKMVILDHDPDHVDTLGKCDMKVFVGDATRVDLLESAGAAKAEVLINAIDDPETSIQMVELVKEHFPALTIISRARDVDHYIRLRQAGVEAPERETFEGALKSGRMALENLGLGAYEARERADLFRRFNTGMVEEMAAMAGSTATERAAVFKRTSAMLTEIINEDRNHLSLIQRHGWQGTEEGKHTGDPADEPESKPSV